MKYHLKQSGMYGFLSFSLNLDVAMTNRKLHFSGCAPTGNQFTPNQKKHNFKNISFVLGAKVLLFYQTGDLIFVIKLKLK